MAVAGMSNRDIAQALFVTPKTVEWHLAISRAPRTRRMRSAAAQPQSSTTAPPRVPLRPRRHARRANRRAHHQRRTAPADLQAQGHRPHPLEPERP
ncbi:MAG: hypothetical protein DLM64_01370 [Solirubrobacterales bacterium]|nr:MAG: hypothetical protein DLM64_01370 [Solirubrobacterales bacterium]